ncbi:MAG: NAD(P)H-dependent oxidoreductase [Hyphomonas sp.]|nr:NAD(P)H-dependent oxidoreductase [Hyphomonas sp.]
MIEEAPEGSLSHGQVHLHHRRPSRSGPSSSHPCPCDAYADGAVGAGHTVSRINISDFDIACLHTPAEITEPPPEPILSEREKIGAADHLVIAFPLWMGGMPAKLKAFFEQAARGGYFVKMEGDGWPEQMMKGKTARVLVSMAMPGPVYRFGMDEGALKALERGILGLSGFRQVHHTLIGGAQRLPRRMSAPGRPIAARSATRAPDDRLTVIGKSLLIPCRERVFTPHEQADPLTCT